MKEITAQRIQQKYKGLFVSDLDGTLLNDQRQVSAEDLTALTRLRDEGYLVAIATGRSNYSFNKLMDTLGFSGNDNPFPVDYIIFSTGAGIMDFPARTLLKSFSLSPGDVRHIVRHITPLNIDYMIHRPVPNTRCFLYNSTGMNNEDFHTRVAMYSDFATPVSPESLDSLDGATEVLCIVPEATGHQTASMLADIFRQFSVIKATSPLDGKSIWVEIFSPEVSKSQAVKWLAGTVAIPRQKICAVGNDYNDEDLLNWAQKGYVVANSPLSLKSRFHTVASNTEGGVSESVAHWLNI